MTDLVPLHSFTHTFGLAMCIGDVRLLVEALLSTAVEQGQCSERDRVEGSSGWFGTLPVTAVGFLSRLPPRRIGLFLDEETGNEETGTGPVIDRTATLAMAWECQKLPETLPEAWCTTS